MTTQNQVSEIQTSAGILRVWDNSGSGEIFHFATPSGSQGSEPTFDSAVAAAFAAEGLDAAEYGYTTLATASHAAA